MGGHTVPVNGPHPVVDGCGPWDWRPALHNLVRGLRDCRRVPWPERRGAPAIGEVQMARDDGG